MPCKMGQAKMSQGQKSRVGLGHSQAEPSSAEPCRAVLGAAERCQPVQHCPGQHQAVPCRAEPCHAMPSYKGCCQGKGLRAVPGCAVMVGAGQGQAGPGVLCMAGVLSRAMQGQTVLSSAKQSRTVPCSAMQCDVELCRAL